MEQDRDYQPLAHWAEIVVDGATYRWSAQRLLVRGEGNQARRMVQIQIGRLDQPTVGVLFPEDTEPTEVVVADAIRRCRGELEHS